MVQYKLFGLLVFLILPVHVFSQRKLVDQNNNTPIPYAHILLDNKMYTYSNQKGEFEIAANTRFDTLKIAHLSYEPKRISYAQFQESSVIPLQEKITMMDEVTITASKKKKRTETLLPGKSPGEGFAEKRDFQILFESAAGSGDDVTDAETADIGKVVYIPNDKNIENAVIKKIVLNSVAKQVKGDSVYIPFKVNLMTYDTINHIPKDRIFKEDLTVGKKKGETLVIDISKEDQVEFPKEGICIVVSVYRTEYYRSKGLQPPRFQAVQIKKSSSFREYSNTTFGHVWEEAGYSQAREQCFNFGIEIEYFK